MTDTAVTVPSTLTPTLSCKGVRYQLRETSSLLHVPEGRASYLALGALLSMAEDNINGDVEKVRRSGVCMRMRQRRRRRKVPIVPPLNTPIPGSDGQVPSLSDSQLAEVHIGVPPHQSGHGIGIWGKGGGRGWESI